MSTRGSLDVVGTGFRLAGHVTPETRSRIRAAERVFDLCADPVTSAWLQEQGPPVESLHDAYAPGRHRLDTYEEMVERMLAPVREGRRVCAAFYGHPGVFVHPAHAAVRRARAEGHAACMLPGISAEDCLFADLEVDPTRHGCANFEATDFIVRPRSVDVRSALVLWQVGGIGVLTYQRASLWSRQGLRVLVEVLSRHYPADHRVVLYEASPFPIVPPTILRVRLDALAGSAVTLGTTLYVPPLGDDREAPAEPPAPDGRSTAAGTLVVAGIGHGGADRVTPYALSWMRHADRLFVHSEDADTVHWLRTVNASATPVPAPGDDPSPGAGSSPIVDPVLATLGTGRTVCVAVDGHPAVGMPVVRELVRRARAAGHRAQLLPAISAADCLYAELGVDPGASGCQLVAAGQFAADGHRVDTATPLIVLRAGAPDPSTGGSMTGPLSRRLSALYPPAHRVALVEGADGPADAPRVEWIPLADLPAARAAPGATLYLPAMGEAAMDEDALRQLGLALG
ncbi:MAG TPA: SAM-dependent methyltransferase [Gemmatimonadaceae bacterium]|nr:SAM-dependent methyltransferase [Gemmatimonadaceae bacterium]